MCIVAFTPGLRVSRYERMLSNRLVVMNKLIECVPKTMISTQAE